MLTSGQLNMGHSGLEGRYWMTNGLPNLYRKIKGLTCQTTAGMMIRWSQHTGPIKSTKSIKSIKSTTSIIHINHPPICINTKTSALRFDQPTVVPRKAAEVFGLFTASLSDRIGRRPAMVSCTLHIQFEKW